MRSISHSNRGTDFERTVIACLEQIPDELGVFLRDSPAFKPLKFLPGGKVIGFFTGRGGLDFYGTWRGRFVGFDAKSTRVPTRFPLSMLHPHQVEVVRKAHGTGAIAFFLIEMAETRPRPRVFCLSWDVLAPYWRRHLLGEKGGASIPYDVLARDCVEVRPYGVGFYDIAGALDAIQRKAMCNDQSK